MNLSITKLKLNRASAAPKLTGAKRREYEAEETPELFGGSARLAAREMGWGRNTVAKGMKELSSGMECYSNYQARGARKTEEKLPNLERDIRELVE